jgi:hypothetical protein
MTKALKRWLRRMRREPLRTPSVHCERAAYRDVPRRDSVRTVRHPASVMRA